MSVVARNLWDGQLIWMVEEAFERVQISPSAITGEQLNSALRSIRLQLISWSATLNHAWSVEQQEFPLTYGQKTITLPVGALAIAEGVYRDDQGLDTEVVTVSREEWSYYPDKNIVGDRPTHLWVDKKHNVGGARQLTTYMWQLPGHNGGSLVLSLIMTAQDSSNLGSAPEIPQTWFDAMCAALAWRLSTKFKPEMRWDLKRDMDDAELIATGSTAERAPFVCSFQSRRRHG